MNELEPMHFWLNTLYYVGALSAVPLLVYALMPHRRFYAQGTAALVGYSVLVLFWISLKPIDMGLGELQSYQAEAYGALGLAGFATFIVIRGIAAVFPPANELEPVKSS